MAEIQENRVKSRATRKTVTKDIIKNVRKSVAKNYGSKQCAEEAEISYTCAHNLVSKICNGLSDDEIVCAKKGRPSLCQTDLKLHLRNILTRDPASTLGSLRDDLAGNANINTSASSISRCLRSMGYSRKRLCKVPEERNTLRTLDARQVYCREISSISDGNLIFLDETGFNLHLSKKYGYSPVNSKCYVTVPANRNKNISLLLSIRLSGIVGFHIKVESFDGTGLISYVSQILIPHFMEHPNDILIMDNCRFHHRSDVKQLFMENNINCAYLPAYSPQLNPIEEYFSHLKAKYTSLRPMPRNKDEIISRVTHLLYNDNIDFRGWFRNMRVWLERGLARNHFE